MLAAAKESFSSILQTLWDELREVRESKSEDTAELPIVSCAIASGYNDMQGLDEFKDLLFLWLSALKLHALTDEIITSELSQPSNKLAYFMRSVKLCLGAHGLQTFCKSLSDSKPLSESLADSLCNTIQYLLNNGADINGLDEANKEYSALLWIFSIPELQYLRFLTAEFLLDKGADMELEARTDEYTLFLTAAYQFEIGQGKIP